MLLRCFDLAPSIDLKSKMLLDNIGVGVSDADCGSLLHNIELVVVCHHLDTTVLVAHDAFGYAIQTAYIVISSTFTDNADRLDSQDHIDTGSRLELAHGNEDGFSESGSGSLRLLRLSCFHFVSDSRSFE